MTTKILKTENFKPIYTSLGDLVTVSYTDMSGKEHILADTIITNSMKIDTAIIFEVNNEFGLKTGIGGILGES